MSAPSLQDCIANEARLRSELEDLRSTLNAVPDLLFEVGLDGRYYRVNSPRTDLMAAPPEVLLGKLVADVLPPHASEICLAALADAQLAGFSSGQQFELVLGAEHKWFELSVTRKTAADDPDPRFIVLSRDITQRKLAQDQLRVTAVVFEASREGILIADAAQRGLTVNHAFTHITGYTEEDIAGLTPQQFGLWAGEQGTYDAIVAAVQAQGHWIGEITCRRKNQKVFPAKLSVNTVKNAQADIVQYIGVLDDLTTQTEAQNRIEQLANYDSLTSLPNRALLEDRTKSCIQVARRAGEKLAMLMVSIDQFTAINTTLGHNLGDQLLGAFGTRLKNAVRDRDTVASVSGEGFVVLLPATDSDGASMVATKLLEAVSAAYSINGHEVAVTASIGIARFPEDGDDFDTLLMCVEMAMHRAQTLGHDNFQFFDSSLHRHKREQLVAAAALRYAIERDELQVHYQPLISLKSGAMEGLEALLRWRNAELGDISPTYFIPIAEESGLIKAIGLWVLRRVCSDLRNWIDKGMAVPHVAINVSAVQFRDGQLAQNFQSIVTDYRIDPGLIYVELTEGVLMEDVSKSEVLLRALKSFGFSLSLDDFGTGYSSLSYLQHFPLDKVKIDQSFVRNIASKDDDAVIASIVISMAHGLGLKVIAEGVETEAQCTLLRDNMCDEIQGFLFARAMPADQVELLLREGRTLAPHLLREHERSRTILLVDDEPNVVAALRRLLRRDGYTLLSAASGSEGLEMLASHAVDIIISDQRMPGMTGVEFLRTAKVHYPETLRIVLSGYTELKSVTDAINEGAIYRFLTKPWDDDQLRHLIADAFHYKEVSDENKRLSLKVQAANSDLAASNRELSQANAHNSELIARSELSLNIVREALQHIPFPVLGVDDEGMVAFVNAAAIAQFQSEAPLLGSQLHAVLPDIAAQVERVAEGEMTLVTLGAKTCSMRWHYMGRSSSSRGRIITFATSESMP